MPVAWNGSTTAIPSAGLQLSDGGFTWFRNSSHRECRHTRQISGTCWDARGTLWPCCRWCSHAAWRTSATAAVRTAVAKMARCAAVAPTCAVSRAHGGGDGLGCSTTPVFLARPRPVWLAQIAARITRNARARKGPRCDTSELKRVRGLGAASNLSTLSRTLSPRPVPQAVQLARARMGPQHAFHSFPRLGTRVSGFGDPWQLERHGLFV